MALEHDSQVHKRHRARRTAVYTALLLLIPTLIALEELPRVVGLGPGYRPGPAPGPAPGQQAGVGPGAGKGDGWGSMLTVSRPADMNVEMPGPGSSRAGPGRVPASRDALYGDVRRMSVARVAETRDPALTGQPRVAATRDSFGAPPPAAVRDSVASPRIPDQRSNLAADEVISPSPPPPEPPPQVEAPPPPQPESSAPPMIPMVAPQGEESNKSERR